MVRCAALSYFLFVILIHAQTQKPDPPPGVLESVKVAGNKLYSSSEILDYLGLKPGEKVSVPMLDQARQKLQNVGVFDTISFRFKFDSTSPPHYDVLYQIVEDPQLIPLHFERLGADPSQILAYLKTHVPFYADRIPASDSVIQRYKQAVQEYISHTAPNPVRVKTSVATDENLKLQVNFFPDAPIPMISQVEITGNQAIDKGKILRAVNEVAIGVPLTDARVKLIEEGAIRPVYAARGYPMVTFPKVETEPAKTNSGVVLKITINDGPQFNFGPLRFRGKGLEEDEIRSALTFRPGEVYSAEKVDAFRVELLRKMKRKGLLDATVDPEMTPNEAKHIMEVVYNVIPGEPYKFQKLDIQGLDESSQSVIEKLWGEKPGQTFNPEYPDFFLKKVNEQGLFDNLANTQSDYTADPATHSVVVHLMFRGGKSPEQTKREKEGEDKKNGYPPYAE